MQQPERGSAVAGVDVFQVSELRGGVSAGATSMILQSCWVCAVCNRSVSGSTKALSVHVADEHGWSFYSCKAAVADVIVDLRMLHIAGKHSIKQNLVPAVNVVHSWVPRPHQTVSNIKVPCNSKCTARWRIVTN